MPVLYYNNFGKWCKEVSLAKETVGNQTGIPLEEETLRALVKKKL